MNEESMDKRRNEQQIERLESSLSVLGEKGETDLATAKALDDYGFSIIYIKTDVKDGYPVTIDVVGSRSPIKLECDSEAVLITSEPIVHKFGEWRYTGCIRWEADKISQIVMSVNHLYSGS